MGRRFLASSFSLALFLFVFTNLIDPVFSFISFKNFLLLNLNRLAKRDFAFANFAPNSNGDGVVPWPGKSVFAVVSGGGSSSSNSVDANALLDCLKGSVLVAGNSLKRKMRLFSTFFFVQSIWIHSIFKFFMTNKLIL